MSVKGEYLIVDGYNIINDWPEFEEMRRADLAHAREHLIEILVNYQALGNKEIILVFDAHQVKGGETIDRESGIQVVYSGHGETADTVIEKLVYQIPKGRQVTVATSDWLEQRIVLGKGGLRLSARELRLLVLEAREDSKRYYQKGSKYSTLSARIQEELRLALEQLRRL